MRKVFVEGRDYSLFNMFKEEGWILVNSIEYADLLCLEGGADVFPPLYGEKNVSSTYNVHKDIQSFGLISVAQRLNIPVVGICRGSQVMCVNNGGKMKQHIENHCKWHDLTVNGQTFEVSSSHHQESIPNVSEDYIIRSEDGTCEIVWYKDKNMMGFQPHPEYHQQGHECRNIFFELIDNWLVFKNNVMVTHG